MVFEEQKWNRNTYLRVEAGTFRSLSRARLCLATKYLICDWARIVLGTIHIFPNWIKDNTP